MPSACVFRRPGDIPPMDYFGYGCFANGYQPTYKDHAEFNGEPYDLVAVGGNLRRYGGANGRIFEYYRSKGTPVFVIEMGRLYYKALPQHWFFYLNRVPSWPPEVSDSTRRDRLFPPVEYKPRGENILIVGQDECFDHDLDVTVLSEIKRFSQRTTVWRPRKGHRSTFKSADCVSNGLSVQEDLDRAWAVITHSSNMGGEALMRGIPVYCDPAASYAGIAHHELHEIDVLGPPPVEDVEAYLRGMSYICWSEEEMRSGEALKWFLGNTDLTSY